MREIKFRAWDGKLMHGVTELIFDMGPDLDGKGIRFYGPGVGQGRIDGKKTILMQYTGLKDKNGKDIYEGDILTDHGDEGPLYIEYSEERASFDFVDNFDQFGIVRYATFQISYEQFEVIGNIYENPELLERR